MSEAYQASARNSDFNEGSAPKNKPMPQNIEAEKSVLAACMLNAEAVEELILKLKPESFYRPAHRIIFESICELNTRRIPIDQISLADNLNATGQLEAVGGKPYLVDLADNTFALTNWQNHAEIVKRTAILRELIYAAASINAVSYTHLTMRNNEMNHLAKRAVRDSFVKLAPREQAKNPVMLMVYLSAILTLALFVLSLFGITDSVTLFIFHSTKKRRFCWRPLKRTVYFSCVIFLFFI